MIEYSPIWAVKGSGFRGRPSQKRPKRATCRLALSPCLPASSSPYRLLGVGIEGVRPMGRAGNGLRGRLWYHHSGRV